MSYFERTFISFQNTARLANTAHSSARKAAAAGARARAQSPAHPCGSAVRAHQLLFSTDNPHENGCIFFLLQNIAFLEIVCSIKTDARGYCIFKAVPMNTFTKWKRLVWIFSFLLSVCLSFYLIIFGWFTSLWLNFQLNFQGSHRHKNLQPVSPE